MVARASPLSHSTGPEPPRSVTVHDDDSSSSHGSILSEGERIVRNNTLVVDDRGSPPRCRAGTAQALPHPRPSSLARAASAPGLSPEYWQRFLHSSDRSSGHRDAAVAAGLMLSQRRSSSELSRSLSDLDPITSLNAALATGLQRRSSSAARPERECEYSRDHPPSHSRSSLSVQVADVTERRYTAELLAKDSVILGLKMDALERKKDLAVMRMQLADVKRECDHDVAAREKDPATMQPRITASDTLHKSELEGQIALTRNVLIGTHHDEKDTLIRMYHDEKDTLIRMYHDEKDTLIRMHHDEKDTLIRTHHDEKDTLIRTHHDEKNALIRTHHDEKNALIDEFNKEKNALIVEFNKEKNALIAEFNKEKIELIHQHNDEKNALIRRSDDENKRAVLVLEKDNIVLVGEYKELKVETSYLREELKR
ncbi:hypothetical protein C8Q74DRAFT_1374113 [Fomes fomentarius]|nr:hypothetical protein C8Q74DRAFT_1374113 [Fomes fomentarius]